MTVDAGKPAGIRMVIFDLDGTLVHLPTDYAAVADRLAGIFKTDAKFSPMIPTILEAAGADASKAKDALDMICRYEVAAIPAMTPMRGAKSVVEGLRERGLTVCMVTMQCRAAALSILERLGVARFFSSVITRDESLERLDQIRRTLDATGTDPARAMVVGDTRYDMECAKSAGCACWQVHKAGADDDYSNGLDHILEIVQ